MGSIGWLTYRTVRFTAVKSAEIREQIRTGFRLAYSDVNGSR